MGSLERAAARKSGCSKVAMPLSDMDMIVYDIILSTIYSTIYK
jgi:hypothetical protein